MTYEEKFPNDEIISKILGGKGALKNKVKEGIRVIRKSPDSKILYTWEVSHRFDLSFQRPDDLYDQHLSLCVL